MPKQPFFQREERKGLQEESLRGFIKGGREGKSKEVKSPRRRHETKGLRIRKGGDGKKRGKEP